MLPISRGKGKNKLDKIEAGLLTYGTLDQCARGLLPQLRGGAMTNIYSLLPRVRCLLGTASWPCLRPLRMETCITCISPTGLAYLQEKLMHALVSASVRHVHVCYTGIALSPGTCGCPISSSPLWEQAGAVRWDASDSRGRLFPRAFPLSSLVSLLSESLPVALRWHGSLQPLVRTGFPPLLLQ